MEFRDYHNDHSILHLGTEEPRAYFIPYDCLDNALSGDRNNSYYLTNLCGEWSFKYFDTYSSDVLNYIKSDNGTEFYNVEVPKCFQLYDIDGIDKPLYSNLKYPFPNDPPYVPNENPCGLYKKTFEITGEMSERDTIITFEGVSSCFYLWVNGEFCGYSQVSHSTSEFNISKFLTPGENEIEVLVVKWCDGSYLEDQDHFRLSGIFREVYLLSRSKVRLEDVFIKEEFNEDLSSCTLNIECKLKGKAEILYGLTTPYGDLLTQGESDSESFSIHIDNPALWNDETPFVYTLFLTVEDEIIPFQIALRKVEIKDRLLLINNVPAKLKGVNRHDNNCNTGYYVTVEDMTNDLLLMKRANVNAIRTSHYPNDPRFYDLAEALGFYIVDEADIETHGMGWNTDQDWDWMRWSMLSTVDEWEESYLDRAKLLFERDKNHKCVIMWSLGNESGCGKNHRAMGKFIKSRDESAIIHYENAHLEFTAVPDGEDFRDISDVESRMYPRYNYIIEYLENKEYTKPFFMCEYVCSMSTGDVHDFWKLVDKYPTFCGGCIWEFSDHTLNIPDENGKPRYYYGGDFGDFPNDRQCCIDGLVFSDRRERPGYYDMKKVYEPFRCTLEGGKVTVKSVKYFRALDDLYIKWNISENGNTVKSGIIENLNIAPQGEEAFEIFDSKEIFKGDAFLTLSFCQKKDTPWAEKDYEVGFSQFELKSEEYSQPQKSVKVDYTENDRFVTVASGNAQYIFDKMCGRIHQIKVDGKELLKEPATFNMYHSPTYNQGSYHQWIGCHIHHLMQNTHKTSIKTENGNVVITTDIALGGPSNPPIIRAEVDYIFTTSGEMLVSFAGDIRENAPVLPRLGLKFTMNEENEDIIYFGLGELESYPDRYQANRFGRYETTVTENFVHYAKPQENSSHYKTRRVAVGIKNGAGLVAKSTDLTKDFSFNASHYSDGQLTNVEHDFDLVNEKKTIFSVDARFNALSENEELNNDENNRLFDEKHIEFKLSFRAVENISKEI